MVSIINDDELTPEDSEVNVESEDEMIEDEAPTPILPEDLDPDTPLFEGGPTAGQIVEWKKQYKNVFVTEISYDEYIIWRNIYRGEYRQIVNEISQLVQEGRYSDTEINMRNEELICQIGVLYPKLTPEDFDTQLAGMPLIISQQILESSGFRPIDLRGL